ncbi:MAG: glycosyltransferase [Desulfobacula sp.]|uniref:glycosyltransferase n=1 Tax=Desulfobacula sp. TaxID=2593537 RepID=UPI0025C4991A|nr:glycosyltransferase [Desulfobacula sp.]MCD4720409.1 glycosyltransferase [Desulfobacula sp.]
MPNMQANKILLITDDEKRERYKFIFEPLKSLNHLVKIELLTIKQLDIRTIIQLKKILYKNKYKKIILSTPGFYMVWIVLLRCFVKTKTLIVLRTGGDLYENSKSLIYTKITKKQYLKAIYHFITRNIQFTAQKFCDEYILVSDYLLTCKRYYFLKKSPVYIIPQTKSLKSHKKSYCIKNIKNIRILTIANLNYKEKFEGVLLLIKAVLMYSEKYADKNIHFSFQIIGGGEYSESLKNAVNCNPKKSNILIDYLGFQKNIDDYYQSNDIFVYWSFMDLVPNVILEAQSHGLPVLFFASPGLSKLFSGSALPFKDKDSLLIQLDTIIFNNSAYEGYALKGINNITNNYSIASIAEKLKAVITSTQEKT